MKSRSFILLLMTLLSFSEGQAAADAGPQRVEVEGDRVRLVDVLPSAPGAVAQADLGAAPTIHGSRILHRAELERIFADAGMAAPRNLPAEVRILRKARVLSPREVEEKASSAFSAHPPKGTRLVRVRPPSATTVPSGWDRVELRLPKLPRRTGDVSTTAMLAFQRGPETMMQLPVTLDLSLSEEAGRPDVARGNAVTIVIQHGLVEVSASAVAGADGDVGATIPLTIRTSGKVVRGRLLDKDHAVIVEGL